MKPSEASKKLEFHSKQICHGCVHPSMVGWCENYCQLPEALEMAISALEKQETAKIVIGKSKGGVTFWHECSKCGEPVDAKDIFCRRCGRGLIYETD